MIRSLLVTLAVFCTAAPAFANTFRIEIAVPADLSNRQAAAEFAAQLKKKVRSECARANSPVIAQNYDAYVKCVASAERQAADQDKTGILAAELGIGRDMQLALN